MINDKLAQARAKCAAVAVYMADRDDVRAAASLKAGLKLLEELQSELTDHEAEKQAGRVAVVNDDDPHAILSAALRIMPNTSTLKSEEQAEDIVAVWRAAVASIQCTAVTAPPSTLSEQDKEDAERLDWLEQHDGRLHNYDKISCIVGKGFAYGMLGAGINKTLRGAIDAARAKEEQVGPVDLLPKRIPGLWPGSVRAHEPQDDLDEQVKSLFPSSESYKEKCHKRDDELSAHMFAAVAAPRLEKQAGPVAIQASAVEAELTDEQIDNRTAHLFNGGQLVHRDYRISVVRAALSKPSV